MSKVAIVTGARRGLGKAVAIELARKGFSVVVNDKAGEEELDKLVEDMKREYGVKAMKFFGDVSGEEVVLEFLEAVKKEFDGVDALINNAADVVDMELMERPTELFRETMNNNVMSTYLMSKYFGKMMFDAGSGKIINVSSTNGMNTVYPASIDYDASKAAVINMTYNFAVEFAPRVLVSVIAPGWMRTEMNTQLGPDFEKEESEKILLRRFAEPEEVAKLVGFLAGDDNTYITGSVIEIGGGLK